MDPLALLCILFAEGPTTLRNLHRAGIRTIVLSAENDKDLDDLPEEIRSEMEFHLVSTMDEVIKIAMENPRPAPSPLDPEGKTAEGGIVAN